MAISVGLDPERSKAMKGNQNAKKNGSVSTSPQGFAKWKKARDDRKALAYKRAEADKNRRVEASKISDRILINEYKQSKYKQEGGNFVAFREAHNAKKESVVLRKSAANYQNRKNDSKVLSTKEQLAFGAAGALVGGPVGAFVATTAAGAIRLKQGKARMEIDEYNGKTALYEKRLERANKDIASFHANKAAEKKRADEAKKSAAIAAAAKMVNDKKVAAAKKAAGLAEYNGARNTYLNDKKAATDKVRGYVGEVPKIARKVGETAVGAVNTAVATALNTANNVNKYIKAPNMLKSDAIKTKNAAIATANKTVSQAKVTINNNAMSSFAGAQRTVNSFGNQLTNNFNKVANNVGKEVRSNTNKVANSVGMAANNALDRMYQYTPAGKAGLAKVNAAKVKNNIKTKR